MGNRIRLGKHMKAALDFSNQYAGWHTYTLYHKPTITALHRLQRLGLVELNKCRQFRLLAMPIQCEHIRSIFSN